MAQLLLAGPWPWSASQREGRVLESVPAPCSGACLLASAFFAPQADFSSCAASQTPHLPGPLRLLSRCFPEQAGASAQLALRRDVLQRRRPHKVHPSAPQAGCSATETPGGRPARRGTPGPCLLQPIPGRGVGQHEDETQRVDWVQELTNSLQ